MQNNKRKRRRTTLLCISALSHCLQEIPQHKGIPTHYKAQRRVNSGIVIGKISIFNPLEKTYRCPFANSAYNKDAANSKQSCLGCPSRGPWRSSPRKNMNNCKHKKPNGNTSYHGRSRHKSSLPLHCWQSISFPPHSSYCPIHMEHTNSKKDASIDKNKACIDSTCPQ